MGRQGNRYQMKEQENSQGELHKWRQVIYQKEFRVMIIRILNSMKKDTEIIKKDQSEINNALSEINHTMEGINSTLDEAKDQISDLEDEVQKNTQT